jgi:hypothetical protein
MQSHTPHLDFIFCGFRIEPKIVYGRLYRIPLLELQNSHVFVFVFVLWFLFIGMVDFTRKTYAQTGWRTYRRPDEKSGGHGVGWSPIIPYAFSVPQDWEEVIIYNPNMFEPHIEVVLF